MQTEASKSGNFKMGDKLRESVELVATIGEIGGDVGTIVPVSSASLERIKRADPDEHDAKFAIVAVESGKSKNKRNWSGRILEKIAEQIRSKEPVGYRGHPLLKKDFDKGSDFPDPQTVWLGATTVLDSGKTKLVFKGYNLKDKPIRSELLAGAVDSVSICGDATMTPTKDGWDVEDFDLQSIDWARKGGQGMQGKVLALTGEQDENSDSEEEDGIVKPEDIAALTETDLRRYNADLTSAIEKQGEDKAKQEVGTKVGEQENEINELKPAADEAKTAREKLGLKDDESLIDKIVELVSNAKAGLKEEFKNHVSKTLEKKLKGDSNEPLRALVAQLVGEMDESKVENEEDAQKLAEERVNEVLDSNESVKKLVGEMEGEGERPDLRGHRSQEQQRGDFKKSNSNLEVTEEVVA